MTKKLEVSGLTGEIVEIELEGDDLKQYKADQKIEVERLAKIDADKKAKDIARQEILDRLGLTADDAKLLLG